MIRILLLSCLIVASMTSSLQGEVKITPDVVYGHKHGLAMTFDMFRPQEANGAAVVFMVSGGWYSRWQPPEQSAGFFKILTDRGYTVMAVRHGSSPKFSIPEAVADVRRSIRYIRANAKRFDIDPERIGVYGMSAGGHLALVLATTADDGKADAKDPIERQSDRVTTAVAFVAPTDLQIMIPGAKERLPSYNNFPALKLEFAEAKKYSPLVHVTADDAPTLLIAGAKDDLVPIAHNERMAAALQEKNVRHELMVIPEGGHGFSPEDTQRALDAMVQWFDKELK